MKKLFYSTLLLLSYSCSNTETTTTAPKIFQIVSHDKTNLLITWNEFSANKKPSRIEYIGSGDVINNTTDIYKKVVLRLDIIFVLDNGNELSLAEIDRQDVFISFTGSDFLYHWKPNEKRPFKLKSPSIDISYVDYPITSVKAVYSIEADDEINNKVAEGIVEEIDITDKWKEVIGKVRSGVSDISPHDLSNL